MNLKEESKYIGGFGFLRKTELSLFKGGGVHQGLIGLEINLSSGEKKKDRLVLEFSLQYWNLEKSGEYLQTSEKKVLQN